MNTRLKNSIKISLLSAAIVLVGFVATVVVAHNFSEPFHTIFIVAVGLAVWWVISRIAGRR